MTRIQLRLSAVSILLLGTLCINAPFVYAETYTYSRTLSSSDVGKYSLELVVPGGNCKDFSADVFSTKEECQRVLSRVASNVTIQDSCSKITTTKYSYTSSVPLCSADISRYGFVQTAGPGTPTAKNVTGGTSGTSGGLTGGDTSGAPGGLSGGDTSGAKGSEGGVFLTNPLNNIDSLPELLTAILKGVVEIGAIFLTVMIVYVGFLFVAARGNEEKISSARSALVWTVVGGLILLGAQAISLVIQETVKTL